MIIKTNIVAMVLFVGAMFCPILHADTSTFVTQYGITWTFSSETAYGQFANGDYYVVDPGGGVSITAISNTFHAVDLSTVDYDGSDVDCDRSNLNGTPDQGFDARPNSGTSYASALNVNKNLPYTLNANESLLTSISWQEGDDGIPVSALIGRPYLKRIAILTCISSDVGSTAFRPSYAVGQKTIYYTTNLRLDILPLLTSPSSTDQELTATYESWTQGPWTDLNDDYTSEALRPTDNYMSGTGTASSYNRYVVRKYGEALLGALLNPAISGDRSDLVINLVQIGIDYYGLLKNGAKWVANGGHQHGYKLPILFAGLMLGNSDMLSIGEDYLPSTNTFQDDSTWYISENDWYPTRTVCGDQYFDGESYLNNYTSNCGSCVTFQSGYQYNSTDHPIGTAEWGIRHNDENTSCRDNALFTAGYRDINARPLTAHALAARILNLVPNWNNNAFFDYHDRWVEWAIDESALAFESEFSEDMWDTYRSGAPYVNFSRKKSFSATGNCLSVDGSKCLEFGN